jgi:NAD(P)-dependent dehydrogenase (short-subunit alcohol dehydrogenase family)
MSAPQFGFASTTDEVLASIDLTGKVALVTGASGGLGEETARALASRGAAVVMTARDLAKGERAAEAIRESTGNRQVEVAALELDSLESVRTCAAGFLEGHERLDLLINNAGVMACPFSKTRDGFERQFGTNHLGHFLLTNLLLPAVLSSSPARVVNLSSAGHRMSNVLFEDPGFERTPYDKFVGYGQSKTANILFSVALDQRLADRGVRAYAVHPGAIGTELGRHMQPADIEALTSGGPSGGKIAFKSVQAGAATTCYAATSPALTSRGGVYLEDCDVAEVTESTGTSGVQDYALDADAAGRLWTLSESLVGERFDP